MTATEQQLTDEKIAGSREELDAIAAESAGDPASVAEDLRGWRAREAARHDRVFQIEQRIRDLRALGQLLDDPAAMTAIRGYVTATAEARTKLAFAAANRVFNSATSSPPARPLLIGWWKEIHTLSAALPRHGDGDRYVRGEVITWFRASTAAAVCDPGRRVVIMDAATV